MNSDSGMGLPAGTSIPSALAIGGGTSPSGNTTAPGSYDTIAATFAQSVRQSLAKNHSPAAGEASHGGQSQDFEHDHIRCGLNRCAQFS